MYFSTVLDEKRQALLPGFSGLPEEFHLVGGTGLALQLGHRTSEDFDFFCPNEFDTHELYTALTQDILKIKLTIIQEARNTLDVLTNSQVKLSFIRYPYPLVYPLLQTEFFPVSDYRDIAAMKLIAAAQRATQKDYFDLFFLLEHLSLQEIFDVAKEKYPPFNPAIYLKSLTYFDDCDMTPLKLIQSEASFEEVKSKLTGEAHRLFEKYGLR